MTARPNALLFCTSLLIACHAPPPPGSGNEAAPLAAAADSEPAKAEPVKVELEKVEPPEPVHAPEPGILRTPGLAQGNAPERYTVLFHTTVGDLHLDVRRSWAPLGADRLYHLVRAGYFDDTAFFRVLPNFVAQIGIHGDPSVNEIWRTQRIADDPATQSNVRGMASFATSGKNSRTTQFFINLEDNPTLDRLGFAPLGRIRELEIAQKLYAGYGEGAPQGRGPNQARIMREGNAYLHAEFPRLDYVKSAAVE